MLLSSISRSFVTSSSGIKAIISFFLHFYMSILASGSARSSNSVKDLKWDFLGIFFGSISLRMMRSTRHMNPGRRISHKEQKIERLNIRTFLFTKAPIIFIKKYSKLIKIFINLNFISFKILNIF